MTRTLLALFAALAVVPVAAQAPTPPVVSVPPVATLEGPPVPAPPFDAADRRALALALEARRIANAKIAELPEEKLAGNAQKNAEALLREKYPGWRLDWATLSLVKPDKPEKTP